MKGFVNDMFEHNKPKENFKTYEYFERLNQKYILLQKQYADSFPKLYDDIEPKVFRREYSKGGACIHRGFYSPSASDLVVANCNRGRLLKKPPKDNNYLQIYNKASLYCPNKNPTS